LQRDDKRQLLTGNDKVGWKDPERACLQFSVPSRVCLIKKILCKLILFHLMYFKYDSYFLHVHTNIFEQHIWMVVCHIQKSMVTSTKRTLLIRHATRTRSKQVSNNNKTCHKMLGNSPHDGGEWGEKMLQ
jgi:hypothetical protein